MRLLPWDPDVATVISRIDAEALDLQPEFQRGEVWSKAKKQRLIDSILRDWHVPPIHVVERASTKLQEVLDGQQRLVAIRDFVRGEFGVDGAVEPNDPKIEKLHGLRYCDLPDDVRRQFDQFTLRIYRIVDYKSAEPAELFLRLNQPTNLTGAEQRNAFFGPFRDQMKQLVGDLASFGLDKRIIGFTNARMAYEDFLCRVALTIERRTLAEKISANDLVELYRNEEPMSESGMDALRGALALLGSAANAADQRPRFNKATLYTWLIFCFRARAASPNLAPAPVARLMSHFETQSFEVRLGLVDATSVVGVPAEWLYKVYQDRSTSRVADVSSVILRDLVVWLVYCEQEGSIENDWYPFPILRRLTNGLNVLDEDQVARTALDLGWAVLR